METERQIVYWAREKLSLMHSPVNTEHFTQSVMAINRFRFIAAFLAAAVIPITPFRVL